MRIRATACATLLLALCAASAHAEIVVDNPWVREVPPVSDHSAAYMHLHNHGDSERRLVAVEADGFDAVEIHETVERDGVARMKHREAVVIPPHGQAILQPGGYHLMLMRRSREAPVAGDEIGLELEFADGERIAVTATVVQHAPGRDDHGGASDHQH